MLKRSWFSNNCVVNGALVGHPRKTVQIWNGAQIKPVYLIKAAIIGHMPREIGAHLQAFVNKSVIS